MRWSIIRTVCGKELLETMRDRRTMILMLFLPVVLYPALLVGFSQLITHQVSKNQQTESKLMIAGKVPNWLLQELRKMENLRVIQAENPPARPATFPLDIDEEKARTEGREPNIADLKGLKFDDTIKEWSQDVINRGDALVVMVVSTNFTQEIDGEGSGTVLLFHDSTNFSSVQLNSRLRDYIVDLRARLREKRTENRPELSKGFPFPILLGQDSIATAKRKGGYFAGHILPLMMIIMIMLGAFYPAVDLTAGEKERGTMQTLMTAPAYATEIILGKFLAVSFISITSAIANLGSMALAIVYLLESSDLAEQLNFQLDAFTGIVLFLQLIPVAVLFSALMLAVSIFAKSFKEAQNYLTPLYLIIIIPAVLSSLPGFQLTHFTAWLPILNLTLLTKQLLVDPPSIQLIVMVLIANLAYSALALITAVRIFKSEQVLLGGKRALADVLKLGENRQYATPSLSFGVFGLGLVIFFYLGGYLQKIDIIKGLVASEYLLLLLPTLILVWRLKLDWRNTLSIRPPTIKPVVAAILLGTTSWAVLGLPVMWTQEVILPQPPQFVEMMEKTLGLNANTIPIWQMLFIFAFTPAVCEETLFRGLLLAGFRRSMNKWPAIILTAICFGIFHVSIYRIIPTAVIGIVAGVLVYESRSIWPGILFHFLHNGLSILVARGQAFRGFVTSSRGVTDWTLFAILTIIFILGLVLLVCRDHGLPSDRVDSSSTEQ